MARSNLSFAIAFFYVCLHCIAEILRSIWESLFPARPKSLDNEVVVITGAGKGLGKALAREMSRFGAIVVLWDIDSTANQSVATSIRLEGGAAYAYTVISISCYKCNDLVASISSNRLMLCVLISDQFVTHTKASTVIY